jgi:hypothetical protein
MPVLLGEPLGMRKTGTGKPSITLPPAVRGDDDDHHHDHDHDDNEYGEEEEGDDDGAAGGGRWECARLGSASRASHCHPR